MRAEALLAGLEAEAEATSTRLVGENPDWPCGAGCDHCCRSLPELPFVSALEGERLRAAVEALSDDDRAAIEEARVVAAGATSGPITCPLLDPSSGRCRVYAARPLRCRTYGFHADGERVLGCEQIAQLAVEQPHLVWGNHRAVARQLDGLGPTRSIAEYLPPSPRPVAPGSEPAPPPDRSPC